MLYLRLFKYADFSKLWFAQILSGISQNLLNFSLIIVVYELTLGSQFANLSVSLLVLTFGLPALLFAPIAGAYVDHWDRKKVLVVANLLRAALVLTYVLVDHNLWLILVISFIVSSILQFFVPAETASIPNVVPKSLLLVANSLFIFTLYAAFIIGYSGSGPAIHYLGQDGPYWAVGGMLLVAALLTALLDLRSVSRRRGPLPKPHPIQHLRTNWKIITSNRDRMFSALQLTVTQAMVSVLITLAPALSLAVLHIPLKQASHILIIPIGLGLVLGVVLVTTISKKLTKMKIIQGGLVMAGVILTLVGLSGQLYRTHDGATLVPLAIIPIIVAILMLVLGMLNALISAAAQTMLQESTDDENRGKVFASLNMMVNLAATTPILLTGLLADLLSVTKVITILGVLATVYALLITWRYRRSVLA